ncbi:MAG: M20 family metallopeptidase [Balneolaceae bacterium]|nr:M20 family metallopeptidase [Balneolaceae bacterium]
MASNKELTEQLAQHLDKHAPQWIDLRRAFHRRPEVSYQEFETTQGIVELLTQWGWHVERPLETGCVATWGDPDDWKPDISTPDTNSAEAKTIAIRADIDALPMQEEGEAKQGFFSEYPGVAHCCGHDAHTTILLGVAQTLAAIYQSKHLDPASPRVVLVFQPGEETTPGGARLLMEEGTLQRIGVHEIVALHTAPFLPTGTVALNEGMLMARPDEFELTLQGKGGHAGSPHECIDPIVMASNVVSQFQTIASRQNHPADPVVVTVGSLHAGHTYNVIPETAELKGTVRTFSAEQATLVESAMRRIAEGVASSYGGQASFTYRQGYPAVINHPEPIKHLRQAALEASLKTQSLDKPLMAGEDFSFYQQSIPGALMLLGSGNDDPAVDSQYMWHHPKYNVDEASIVHGVALFIHYLKAHG